MASRGLRQVRSADQLADLSEVGPFGRVPRPSDSDCPRHQTNEDPARAHDQR
jgi:hypothetical protein